ncbi:MAG: sensor histidine kinase, partial [Acidobacteriota bacterium]
MTHPPATLGRGLGRSLALASVLGMLVFAIVIGVALYVHEIYDPTPEDPPLEIMEEVAVSLAVALPAGVGLALLIGRRLTHPTTDRLDEVISSASRMTGERLDERLPVSPANDALDRLSTALNGVLERIEAGVGAQRQFAADASHELRTPLAVISTNLEVARRKMREPAHWERVADETLAEVRRMHQLVDKLLVLARTGEAGLHHAPTDLRALAAGAVDRVQVLANERGVKVELAPGADVQAELDSDAIAIVIDNLIRNALDHSPKGQSIVVRVESGPRLAVEDRGPGVPAELRDRIFQPFARGSHNSDRAAGPGVGLGLAICKRIVAGHKGSISVEDRAGGGARFVVRLP